MYNKRPIEVLIVSHIFAPDELGGAALMTDLAMYLKEQGMAVRVISTFPYYPRWRLAEEDKGIWKRVDTVGGIEVKRLRMYVPLKPTTIKRLLSDLSYFLSLSVMGARSWREADVIVSTCPLLGQTLGVSLAAKLSGKPKVLIVQDFVVDAAIELGMVKGKIACCILRWIERAAFGGFRARTTISAVMLEKLNRMGLRRGTNSMVPNWVHSSLAKSIQNRRNVVTSRQDNVLIYSGNVGKKQGLNGFLEAFVGSEGDWRLKIYGGGVDFENLRTSFNMKERVCFAPLQDEKAYVDSLLSCTACLITQKNGVGANFLPSKVLPALAAGTPILAICDETSPLGVEVIQSGCGIVIDTVETATLQEKLKEFFGDKKQLEKYSENALNWSVRYERNSVLQKYRELIVDSVDKQDT